MPLWSAMLAEAREARTLWLFLAIVLAATLVRVLAPGERSRLRVGAWFFILHLLSIPISGAVRASSGAGYAEAQLVTLFLGALTAISVGSLLLLNILLPRVFLPAPRILRDVVVAVAASVAFFALASRLGFNLGGLIATSAVLTAVIGFSLQDTLGNIIGGLALQLDNSIRVGDWIKFGDTAGRVSEIRWRHTAIETRNWETMIVPNSVLMKAPVLILGRRHGEPLQLRRWVYFNVDFRFQPSDVIACVEDALRSAPIDGVAKSPGPSCILMSLDESYARYAVRYWLADLQRDDPTDSVVRTRVYFALQRARIPLSIPAQAVFQTKETTHRREEKWRADLDRRAKALVQVELFRALSDEERTRIAEHLRYAPFTHDEIMTRQGAEAHWLYIMVEGSASVRVTAASGVEREVQTLRAPAVFGEISLLTGGRREATVVAVGDVECYRLDRSAFQEIVAQRSDVADHCAELLARRRAELAAVKENLDQEQRDRRMQSERETLLHSLREFFGLTDTKPPR